MKLLATKIFIMKMIIDTFPSHPTFKLYLLQGYGQIICANTVYKGNFVGTRSQSEIIFSKIIISLLVVRST